MNAGECGNMRPASGRRAAISPFQGLRDLSHTGKLERFELGNWGAVAVPTDLLVSDGLDRMGSLGAESH